MLLMKHPYSGGYWTMDLIGRYASLDQPPMTIEATIEELEDSGFESVWLDESIEENLEAIESGSRTNNRILTSVQDRRRPTENRTSVLLNSVKSPYLTAEEAASYLKVTIKGLYGLVERKRLEKCPGPRKYLFTQNMLDNFVLNPQATPKIRRKR